MSVDRNERALAVYEWLRSANPHLPPAEKVSGELPIELGFGPDHVSTVSLTVIVALPDVPVGNPL